MAKEFNNNHILFKVFGEKDTPFDDQDFVLQEYTDYYINGGEKKIKSKDLGIKFASINSFFFDYLKEYHIPSGFIKTKNKRSLKFIKHERFPFMVKILNIIDKRTAKIFGEKEGAHLQLPIFEYHYGNDKQSLVSESHLISFNLCTFEELRLMVRICSKINAVLKSFFERRSMVLAEVCCIFGKSNNKIFLVDDFTPKSLKIFPVDEKTKWSDPYKLVTASQIKSYTDHLSHLMSV